MIVTALQRDIDLLEPMPASAVRLARMVSDCGSRIDDIVRVIELDPALTAHVIRLSNSALFAGATPIMTVKAAVIRLGLARVLWLAVGQRVARPMQRSCPAYQLAEGELWRHSVASALAAEQLCRLTGQRIPGVAFTGSLLHDIGKLVMSRFLPPDANQRVQQLMAAENMSIIQAERRLLGSDHAEVGGAMALAWKFPQPLVAAIARHHEIAPDRDDSLLDAIQISNAITKLVGIGIGGDHITADVDDRSPKRLGLSAAGLESACAAVCDEIGRVIAVCGPSTSDPAPLVKGGSDSNGA